MSEQPDVNLGSVGFGLLANTDQLNASLAVLTRFGQTVDRVTASATALDAAYVRSLQRIESTLTRQFSAIEGTSERLRKAGAAGQSALDQLNNSYQRVAQTVATGDLFQPQELARAFNGVNAELLRAKTISKDLEDAEKRRLAQAEALFRAQQRAQNITTNLGIKGAPSSFVDQAQGALRQYQTTLAQSTLSTEQLQQANQKLTASLNDTIRAFRAQSQATNMSERAALSLARQTATVSELNTRASRFGIDSSLLRANEVALKNYGTALQGLGSQAQGSALLALQTALHATRDAMNTASRAGSTLSNVMGDVNKATILAMGPLSGFGARISVIDSLLRSGAASTALFVVGLVGAGVAVFTLGSHAVKASMEMERFNALLTSSAGATLLVGEEYSYLLGQANKLGQAVQGLVGPYAQFATASRLSGMSLTQQRNIFEGVMTAGAALRWDTDKTSRAFLALEQMVSKGQVQMQEMKLQLGQVLPGAMELAASAMGKTTGEFLKMMEAGQVLPNDLLPKLADLLKKVFGVGAVEGAKTLQAEIARLSTATFEFNVAMDKTLQSSNAVRTVVIKLAEGVNYLKENMDTAVAAAIGLAATIASFGVIAAAIALWTRLAAAIATVGASVAAAGGFLGFMSMTAAAIPGWGTLLSLILRVGGALGAGALAYNAFKGAAQDTTAIAISRTEELNTKFKSWIESVNEAGFAHKRTAEMMKEAVVQNIQMLQGEIWYNGLLLQSLNMVEAAKIRKGLDEGPATMGSRNLFGARGRSTVQIPGMQSVLPPDPRIAELNASNEAMQKLIEVGQKNLEKFKDMKMWNPEPGAANKDAKGAGAWESWMDQIKKAGEEVTKWNAKTEALKGPDSQAVIDAAEALEKMRNTMEKMPDKKKNIGELTAWLKANDYWAGTVESSLLRLFTAVETAESAFKKLQERQKEVANAAKEVTDEWSKMATKLDTAKKVFAGGNPEDLRNQEQLAENLRKVTGLFEKIGLSQEHINFLTAEYTKMWNEERGIQKDMDRIKFLETEIAKLGDTAVFASERAWKEWTRSMQIIEEALRGVNGRTIIDEARADALRTEANKTLYERLWQNADEYTKKVSGMLRDLEGDASDMFAEWAMGGGSSWRDMLKKMERDLLSFGARMIIMKPLFNYLFGDLMRPDIPSGNNGVLGGMIPGIGRGGIPGLGSAVGGIWNWITGAGSGPTLGGTTGAHSMEALGSELFDNMILAVAAHSGGMVGSGPSRAVPALTFAGAQRMHSGGLLDGEVPIIGQRGERMLNKTQNQEWERDQQGGKKVTLVQNLYFNDVKGVAASRGQIGAQMIDLLEHSRRNR